MGRYCVLVLAALCAFCVVQNATAQGVCYRQVSQQTSGAAYTQTSRALYRGCGWRGWRRCRSGTAYGSASRLVYNAVYSSVFGCCNGYSQSGTTCSPICSGGCLNGGRCISPETCSCVSGWTGSNCGTDVNECALSNGGCAQVCHNIAGSYSCSCNTGYRLNGDGRTCAEINECAERTALCEHNCRNTPGSYTCSCNTGYSLSSNGYSCINNNECALGTDGCAQNCHDTLGSYTCSCRTGYTLAADGRGCNDNDECTLGTDLCAQNCHNTIGSYTCSCNTGYTLSSNGYSCINIDECTLGTDMCAQNCMDTPGSYTCSCRAGYTLAANGRGCNDNNECALGTDRCDQNCHNNIGSYTCSCNTGYTLNRNGFTCDNINECALGTHTCAQNCHDIPGSYTCSCRIGYTLDADGRRCNDNDECTLGTDRCDQNCHNTIGSYTCSCNTGYTLNANGYTCDDNDECSSDATNDCQHICVNTLGSYRCQCRIGYRLNPDGRTCSDINECVEGTDNCDQVCHNNIGSFTCTCNAGATLASNGHSCIDIDECASSDTNVCQQVCNNTHASYSCGCHTGYVLNPDQSSCSDFDECAAGTDLCVDPAECINTRGSYNCSCGQGLISDEDSFTCDDINECGGNEHGCQQVCNNTQSSYHCACFRGFILNDDGVSCRDLDECATGMDTCDQACQNTIGSYSCSCNITGYTLNPNGFRCDDINECLVGQIGNTTCAEGCVNTPGSWQCGCRTGRTLNSDGITCRDEDECTEGVNQCDQMCTNTIGSYTCSCNSSTTLNPDGFHCDDIDECVLNPGYCGETCVNTYGSFYCGCRPGYTINTDGQTCRDADECSSTSLCEQNCTNTVGSFICSCYSGYTLTANELSCLGPPESITFFDVDSMGMTLTWGTPANDSSDGTILNYIVDCSSDAHRAYSLSVTTPASAERQAALQELLPYTSYNCCVAVVTDTGRSLDSCVEQTTLEQEPDDPPENIILASDDPNSLTLNLQPPVAPNGVVTAYTYYIAFHNGSSIIVVDKTLNDSFILEGLLPYQLISVEVSANTSAGEGPKSSVDTIRTAQAAPSIPTGIIVQVTSNTSLTVGWDPPTMPNGVLTNYTIRIYNIMNNYSREFDLHPFDARSVSVDDLDPYIPYTVKVSAHTAAGEGEASSQIAFTEHGVPNIPTISNAIRVSEGVMKVIWVPLSPDEARGVLTSLQIAYQPSQNGSCDMLDEDDMELMLIMEDIDTQSSAVIDGLLASNEYCVGIQVSTIAGESGYSDIIKAELPSDVYVQIRLKLPEDEHCSSYVGENTVQKAADISSAIVATLLQVCDCSYSLEYVTHSRILCGGSDNELIYQSNLLNTNEMSATELEHLVQLWVDNAPYITIAGAVSQVNSYCQVSTSRLGEPECVAVNPTTPTTVESTLQQGTPTTLLAPLLGGLVGAVGVIFLVFVIITVLCVCRRASPRTRVKRVKRKKYNKKNARLSIPGDHDKTQLIGTRVIGAIPKQGVMAETPADYDRADDKVEFANPTFLGLEEEDMEQQKVGGISEEILENGFVEGNEDEEGYSMMAQF